MTRRKLLFAAIIAGIIFSTLVSAGCPKKRRAPKLDLRDDREQQLTIESPRVRSRAGISDEHLQWIDEALQFLQSDIRAQGLEPAIAPKHAVIYVLDSCVLSPETRTPSFELYDPAYGGKFLAAEMVVQRFCGTCPFSIGVTNEYVICPVTPGEPNPRGRLKAAAMFGLEHLDYYYRNIWDFIETARAGHVHPIRARSYPPDVAEAAVSQFGRDTRAVAVEKAE